MNPNELIHQIPTGPIEHFYFLYGAERFYQVEIIKAIKRQLITDDNCDFNLETFDAKSSSLNQWIGSVKTLSFLGGTKLVIVRNLHEVLSNQKDLEELNLQALIDYAKTPLAEACLVITADKVDRRLKLIKTLTELKSAVCCEAPQNDAEKKRLWPWVQARAKESGYSISKNAAESLVNRAGDRPGILVQELEKLLVYAGKNKSISESDITEVIGETKQEIVWDLNEALMGKQTERALKLLHNQLDHGVAPEQILGAISNQFRTVWEVKNYQEQRHPANQIAKKMGAHPFPVQKALKHTQKLSVQQLRRCHAELVQADRSLKSTSHRAEVMEALILNLCILLGTTTRVNAVRTQ
jgi:DNA polymerase-3 subunit delta|tara:strand:- start:114 stop:1175 length:1062 start_codon:yes stop_codon:yes gene_type:complete